MRGVYWQGALKQKVGVNQSNPARNNGIGRG